MGGVRDLRRYSGPGKRAENAPLDERAERPFVGVLKLASAACTEMPARRRRAVRPGLDDFSANDVARNCARNKASALRDALASRGEGNDLLDVAHARIRPIRSSATRLLRPRRAA